MEKERFELSSLVGCYDARDHIAGNPSINEGVSYFCSYVYHWPYFWPSGESVNRSKAVLKAFDRWQRVSDVDVDVFQVASWIAKMPQWDTGMSSYFVALARYACL